MSNIPFRTVIWDQIQAIEHQGKRGTSFSRTIAFEGFSVRMVEYKSGYLADHWCKKGHVVQCLEGMFDIHLESGEKMTMREGMAFIVSDNASSHLAVSEKGAKILIIDGDFLKDKKEP